MIGGEHPSHRVDTGGFNRFPEAELWQDGGQALCQHTFAGSGRTDEQQVMSAGSSNFQRALCKVLTAHIGKVVFKLVCP